MNIKASAEGPNRRNGRGGRGGPGLTGTGGNGFSYVFMIASASSRLARQRGEPKFSKLRFHDVLIFLYGAELPVGSNYKPLLLLIVVGVIF